MNDSQDIMPGWYRDTSSIPEGKWILCKCHDDFFESGHEIVRRLSGDFYESQSTGVNIKNNIVAWKHL